MDEDELYVLRTIDTFFVDTLTPEEIYVLNKATSLGFAERVYAGTSGLLGLARVRVNKDKMKEHGYG